MTVVTGEELRERPVRDLASAIEGTPGVQLTGIGLGRRGISIRGMQPDHSLVLVDDMRVSNSASAVAHSDYELGWVPAEAIERIEVVRGPMSSLYGSEALGGVVNIITRRATDEWRGSFSTFGALTEHGLGGNPLKASAGFLDDCGQTTFIQRDELAILGPDVQRWRCVFRCTPPLSQAFTRTLLAIKHIGAGNLVMFAAHQRQFDLILDVFDVESPPAIGSPRQAGDDLLGKLLYDVVDAARGGGAVSLNGEECLGERDGDLRGVERCDGAIATDQLIDWFGSRPRWSLRGRRLIWFDPQRGFGD